MDHLSTSLVFLERWGVSHVLEIDLDLSVGPDSRKDTAIRWWANDKNHRAVSLAVPIYHSDTFGLCPLKDLAAKCDVAGIAAFTKVGKETLLIPLTLWSRSLFVLARYGTSGITDKFGNDHPYSGELIGTHVLGQLNGVDLGEPEMLVQELNEADQ
jgi:hypothetical protein